VKEVGENGAWHETKTEKGLLEGIFSPSSLQNTEEVIREDEKRDGNNRRREYG